MVFKQIIPWMVLVFFLGLASSHPGIAEPLPQDSFEEFKRAFRDTGDPARKTKLISLVEGNVPLGHLCRIIRLPEWQFVESSRAIGDANIEVRNSAIKAFKNRSLKILQTGKEDEKLEIAVLAGETAFSNLNDETSEFLDQMAQRSKYLRKELAELGPELAKAARSNNLPLSRASVLAMSKIETNPSLIAGVISDLISEKSPLDKRRAAAESMNFRLKIVGQLLREIRVVRTQDNLDLIKDLLDTSRLLFPIATKALNDKDPFVRENIAQACRNSSATIVEVDYIIPTREAEMASLEKADVIALRVKGFREALKGQESLIKGYRDSILVLTDHATNKEADIQVRVTSLDVIEDLAIIRKKLADFEGALSRLEILGGLAVPKGRPQVPYDLFPENELASFSHNFTRALKDKNAQVRLNTVDVLDVLLSMSDIKSKLVETGGSEIIKTLSQIAVSDPNKMVKYGAIRGLRRVAPLKPELVVPSLGLALHDEDLDVRIECAKALGHYGEKALPVLDSIKEMVNRGDPEARLALMKTVEKAGTGASGALGAVSKNLNSKDPRVRIKAAETLGAFGKLSQGQIPALMSQLSDPDSGVRSAVSSALLKIRSGA